MSLQPYDSGDEARLAFLRAAHHFNMTLSPAAFVGVLERSPFRLLSEAEWEASARGGRRGEISWQARSFKWRYFPRV